MKRILSLILSFVLCTFVFVGCDNSSKNVDTKKVEPTKKVETENNYKPVTITVDLDRSGKGDKVEQTFTKPPKKVVALGDQMADYFFDLGLEKNMVGYTHGSCWSTVSQFPARKTVPLIGGPKGKPTKEELVSLNCDFLMGWDSAFSEKRFNKQFCQENKIAMYTPYCASDSATFEDIYKDYETLGKIFNVEKVAEKKIAAMKAKLKYVREKLGEDVYKNPINVLVHGGGKDNMFTACQGMPGDMLKLAGARSTFDDIKKGWASVSWEQIVERNPDVILILDYNGEAKEKMDALYANDALKTVNAIKNKKIIVANASDMEGSAGSAGTVEIIAKSLYPDKFKK